MVAFAPLPVRYSKLARVETWGDVPPTSVNYGLARDIILQHMEKFLNELQPASEKNLKLADKER